MTKKTWVQDTFSGGENDLLPPSDIRTEEVTKLTNLVAGYDSAALKVRGGTASPFANAAKLRLTGDTTLGETIASMYRFSRTLASPAGTEIDLVATPSRVLSYDNNGVCTLKHTWAHSGYDTGFTTMLNTLFACNGTDPMVAWNPSDTDAPNFVTVTDRGSTAPIAQRLIAFRGRLWGFDANGRQVIFSGSSDISDAIPNTTPQKYYRRWENWSGTLDSDGGFDTIGDDDGQLITGIGYLYNGIVVFKERSVYLWSFSDSLHPNDVAGATKEILVPGVGCSAHDTIVYKDGAMLFLGQNARGDFSVYRLLGSGIDDIAVKIPHALARVVATGTSKPRATLYDSYYLLAADDTDEAGVSRTLVYAYDTRRQLWFEIDGWNVGAFAYNKERQRLLIGCGTADSKVLEYPSGTTDEGAPISYTLRTRQLDGGNPMLDWKWDRIVLDVNSPAETVHAAASLDGGEFVEQVQTYENADIDYWELPDGSGYDGSAWDDGSYWHNGDLYKRLTFDIGGRRGSSLTVQVSGETANPLKIRRVAVDMRQRKRSG